MFISKSLLLKQVFYIGLLLSCFVVFVKHYPNHGKKPCSSSQEAGDRYCACKQCTSQPNISLWFDTRFDPSVHPLLSENNFNLSSDILAWWKALQGTNTKHFTNVMQRLFTMFPGKEQLMDGGSTRCRSCAVVGNSDNLLGSSYGSQIDNHDFVMRINEGRTKGYEKDVGEKTTHHFMYPESATDLDNNTSLVLIPFKILDFQWLMSAVTDGSIRATYKTVKSRIKFNKEKVLFYNPAFMMYVKKHWTIRGKYPSTGIMVVMFAIHVCDEVSVYGFGADKEGRWRHYWENISGNAHLGIHGGNTESNILQMLHYFEKIRLNMGKGSLGI